MTDPYKVLGISPSATDEQVKEAYRTLSKRYHPDHNPDGVMGEIANDKLAEINAAYDEIMNMRRSGAGGNSYASSYSDIRSMIEHGNYTAADNALESNRNDANAEWNFLKGTVCLSRGWMNDAYNYYSKAVQLDPQNREYQMAFSQLNNKRGGQQMYGNPYNNNTATNSTADSLCQICQCLICLDCLCDCF